MIIDAQELPKHDTITLQIEISPVNYVHRLLQRWNILPKHRRFVFNPLVLCCVSKISGLIVNIDTRLLDKDNVLTGNHELITHHSHDIAVIIASALTNSDRQPKKSMVSFIERNFTPIEILNTLQIVLIQMDIATWLSAIVKLKGLNILQMEPTN